MNRRENGNVELQRIVVLCWRGVSCDISVTAELLVIRLAWMLNCLCTLRFITACGNWFVKRISNEAIIPEGWGVRPLVHIFSPPPSLSSMLTFGSVWSCCRNRRCCQGTLHPLQVVPPTKGGTKRDFVVFASKIQLLSKEVCYKVFLCENVQRQLVATSMLCIDGLRSKSPST